MNFLLTVMSLASTSDSTSISTVLGTVGFTLIVHFPLVGSRIFTTTFSRNAVALEIDINGKRKTKIDKNFMFKSVERLMCSSNANYKMSSF